MIVRHTSINFTSRMNFMNTLQKKEEKKQKIYIAITSLASRRAAN